MNNMIIPLFKVISSHSLQKTSALETAIDTFLTNPSEESVKPLQDYFDALYSSHADNIRKFNKITTQLHEKVQEKSALKERNKLITETTEKDNQYTFHFQRLFLTALLKSKTPKYQLISTHITDDLKSIIGPYINLLGKTKISPSIPKLVSTQMTRIDAINSNEMLKERSVTLLSTSTPITNTENEQWVNYVNDILQNNKNLSQTEKSDLLNLNIKQLHLLSKLKSLDGISLESTNLNCDLSKYFQKSPLTKVIDHYLSRDDISSNDIEILFKNEDSLEKLHEVTPQEGSVASKLTPLLTTLKKLKKEPIFPQTIDQLDEKTYIQKIFEDITQTSSLGLIRLAVNKASEFKAIYSDNPETIDKLVSQEFSKLTTQLSKFSLDALEKLSAEVKSKFSKANFEQIFIKAKTNNIEYLSKYINLPTQILFKEKAKSIFIQKISSNTDHLSVTQLAKLYNANYSEPRLKNAIFDALESKLLAKKDETSKSKLNALYVLQFSNVPATKDYFMQILDEDHTISSNRHTFREDDQYYNFYTIGIKTLPTNVFKKLIVEKSSFIPNLRGILHYIYTIKDPDANLSHIKEQIEMITESTGSNPNSMRRSSIGHSRIKMTTSCA